MKLALKALALRAGAMAGVGAASRLLNTAAVSANHAC
jgi:hypothetical protein